jgi:hypothetical protein
MKTGGVTLTATLAHRPAQVSYVGYETVNAATDFKSDCYCQPVTALLPVLWRVDPLLIGVDMGRRIDCVPRNGSMSISCGVGRPDRKWSRRTVVPFPVAEGRLGQCTGHVFG